LIDETFATATYTIPIVSGWVSPHAGSAIELVPRLTEDQIGVKDVALAPSSALPRLQQTHAVVSSVAVIADGVGAIAMRTPVRPDEIETTPVRLLDVSGTAEMLTRATLKPFYGIDASGWVHEESPEAARAEVVIVEGAEALREPEAGFSEDLSRAWFILTAQPVVTHILLAPHALASESLDQTVNILTAARSEGQARRREWRPALADNEAIPRERANAYWAAQRHILELSDQQALLDLIRRGSRDRSDSCVTNVQFVRGADST
jgi:hypothetical protein